MTTPALGSHAENGERRLSPPSTASRAALRSLVVLTIAARVVGDAGGPQLREAGFTSAAVPTGAFTAQAVFLASVGRHRPLLSFGEEAPPHGVPIPEPPSTYSQSLRIPWHAPDVDTPFLSDLSVARGRQRLSESVGRSILRRGGPQAPLSDSVAHLDTLVDTNPLSPCASQSFQLFSCNGCRLGVGVGGHRLPRTMTLKLLLPPRLACLTSARHLGRVRAHLYSHFHRQSWSSLTPWLLLIQSATISGHKSGPPLKSTLSILLGTWAHFHLVCGCCSGKAKKL